MSQAILTDNYSSIESDITSDLNTNFSIPPSSVNLGPPIEVSNSNWADQIKSGSQVYLNQKFGRDQSQHDLNLSRDRAKDIKKLMRSQCIYETPDYINTGNIQSNDDYIDYFPLFNSPVNLNIGYELIDKYTRGVDNKLKYWVAENGERFPFTTSDSPNSSQDILPILTHNEDASGDGSKNWNYIFNSLYYPNESEMLIQGDILPIDYDQLRCVPINEENSSSCSDISFTGVTDDSELLRRQHECITHDNGNTCRLTTNLTNKILSPVESSSRNLQIEDSESPGSKRLSDYGSNFKDGDDLGKGLYGRWDSVNRLCGNSPMKCTGTLDSSYVDDLNSDLINANISPPSDTKCSIYFSNIINHGKIGNKIDGASIQNKRENYTEFEKQNLCEQRFTGGTNLDTLNQSPLRGQTLETGCTYNATPEYYTDLNLIDKCSVDDLYEKLQGSGMRKIDLEKVEFTSGCEKRKIGYDIENVCANDTGEYLSQSQTIESCIGKEFKNGILREIPNAKQATDCGPDNSGTCKWIPVLKAKEYVNEDSQCNLRCKGGAIQNGSQPYCKSAPDYSYGDNKFQAGYLHPYLNPEWELNNFSCTAIDEIECSEDDQFQKKMIWIPDKNRFKTTVRACDTPSEDGGAPPSGDGGAPPSGDGQDQCQNLEQPDGVFSLGKFFLAIIMFAGVGVFKYGNQPRYDAGILIFGFILILNSIASFLFIDSTNYKLYKYGNSLDVIIKKLSLGSLITIMATIFFTFKLGNDTRMPPSTNMGGPFIELVFGVVFSYVIGVVVYLFFKAGDSQIFGWSGINYINSVAFILISILSAIFCRGGGLDASPLRMHAGTVNRITIIAATICMIGVASLISSFLSSLDVISLSHCYDNREAFSLQEGFTLEKPSECYNYSDCKADNNCVWDEILSIIDGPQDYNIYRNRNKNYGAADEIIELMYGFVYLLNKYSQTESNPRFISSDSDYTYSKIFNSAFVNENNASMNGYSLNQIPNTVIKQDSPLASWVNNWSNIEILEDHSNNKKTINELLLEYRLSPTVLNKVFWHYWNIFHDGYTGLLRPEILNSNNGEDKVTVNSTTSRHLSQARQLGDHHSRRSASLSGGGYELPSEIEVRRSIPILKLIFKNWLNNNIEISSTVTPNGNIFTECGMNRVCTYGTINGHLNSRCKEYCDTDEILDYSAGQCWSSSPNSNIWKDSMDHPDMTDDKMSLRNYHPNFQRFNCEFSPSPSGAEPSNHYYQKTGCIKNDLLNNNVIPGESCADYFERAEASGYNITCNDAVSRAHMEETLGRLLIDQTKTCYTQFTETDPSISEDTKNKICGINSNIAYEWDNDKIIDVLDDSILHTTTGNYLKNTSGISPVISCCVPKSDNSNCNSGNWIPINGGEKGYCSSEVGNTYNNPTDAAEDIGITPTQFCSAFSIEGSPLDGCSTPDSSSTGGR